MKITAKVLGVESVLDGPEHAKATAQYRKHCELLDALAKCGEFMRSLSLERKKEESLEDQFSDEEERSDPGEGVSIIDQSVMGSILRMKKQNLSLNLQKEEAQPRITQLSYV